MPKYTKEQLLAMSIEELQAMASAMKTPNYTSSIREQLVYDIIDAQADEVSNGVEAAPRRRRITTYGQDHVYSATQTGNSERFDSARDERAAKRMVAAKARETEAEAVQALLAADHVEEPPKRKRGRPTKAEVEQRRAYEEMMFRQKTMMRQAQLSNTSLTFDTPSGLTGMFGNQSPAMDTPRAIKEIKPVAEGSVMNENIEVAHDNTPTVDVTTTSETAFSKVSSGSAVVNEAENDDLPDFILAQMRQQAAAAESTTAETEESEEKHPALHNPLATLSQHFQQRSQPQYANLPVLEKAPESDFVIVEDVPVINSTDFSFIPELQEQPYYSEPEPQQVPRFRKFKDDALVNPQLLNREESAPVVQPPTLLDVVIDGTGVLELTPQGTGFLRSSDYNYMPSPDDIFVTQNQVRNYALKMGDVIEGKVKVPKEGEKYFTLTSVDRINGLAPSQVRDRIAFEHLTPLFPDEQFKLSTQPNAPLACRTVDLFSPIGKGQRALIVAQPKTGKTILMKQIANAIAANYPETYLMMLLIDERPEEVTDMARTVNAEVIASTFDEPATHHVRIAQMVLEKAKRMVECGHDVVIFLDSITRLARAFNTVAPTSGKILTGGVDANALQKPKRFFGAARNIENGGSLTIIATALTDTGSKMDEVIFEEFKGTGNMELQLDRTLANKRIFPAVNLIQSSTRRDDLLLDDNTLNRMYIIRKFIGDMSSVEAMDFVKKRLEDSRSNEEFLMKMNK
ncbi:transcription termination factor Rho [Alloprevotella sp. oral taxon 473]|uniref:transcription termination factor Rho n=1 Tax=Alloprevotella sp. oral taxon 473 TaxID=712469 RepID=UPI0002A317F9|nr:transcription termination factor Rho [Alloprevotella sp. oral taxon 473]EKX90452.1 transcription termination factor Rho [Alloprevotella sp. oral taxon 473 str. F0040]